MHFPRLHIFSVVPLILITSLACAKNRPLEIPADLIALSLAEPAPSWRYEYTKRHRNINATFALYTLALAAHQQAGVHADAAPAVITRLRSILTGNGLEPECQGGLGGWTHGPFAWTLAFARHTPGIWQQLTPDEQARANLLMQALATAANFCLDDDNTWRCLIDGDPNWAKGMNPNHVEGYVGVALASAWYFGQEDLDNFFQTFDFDSFLEKLKNAGFTNIVAAWTRTPQTRQALMQGGLFDPKLPRLGLGRGVHRNSFTIEGHPPSQAWLIYQNLATRMFSKVTQSTQRIEGRSAPDDTVHIIDTDPVTQKPLTSPVEGHIGMCYEFLTTNALTNGTRFRGSLFYAYEGWMLHMSNALAIYAKGDWPETPEATANLRSRMYVGSTDLLFKAEHGFHGFANGKPQPGRAQNLARVGWSWAHAWWTDILAPALPLPLELTPLSASLIPAKNTP